MRYKRIAALLLAGLMLGLSGCARLFMTQYRSSTPYVEAHPSEGESNGEEIRNYTSLTRTLRGMVADYTTQGTLVFVDYDGIIADDLSKACWDLRSATALGAFCVQDITFEIEQVVAYCEADIVITYKRSAEDVRNIYTAQSLQTVSDSIVDAMESGRRRFAIQMNSDSFDEGDIQATVETALWTHPLLTVSMPTTEVTMFTGETRQRIFEIWLNYSVNDDTLSNRRASLGETVSRLASSLEGESLERFGSACDRIASNVELIGSDTTAYDVLLQHRGNSLGIAMALKAVCDAMDLPCEIVSGQLDSYQHTWNIVEIDGERYHVDLSGYGGTLMLQPDRVIWGRYWWNTDQHEPCTAETVMWAADAEE